MAEKIKQVLSLKLVLDEERKKELLELCEIYKDTVNFVYVNSFETTNNSEPITLTASYSGILINIYISDYKDFYDKYENQH